MTKKRNRKRNHCRYGVPPSQAPAPEMASEEDVKPDWTKRCEVCGQSPIVPLTGMCGPCTFGEADTAEGNW